MHTDILLALAISGRAGQYLVISCYVWVARHISGYAWLSLLSSG